MLDSNGLIVKHDTRLPQVLFTEANLYKLYWEPVTWDAFIDAINQVYVPKDGNLGCPLTKDEVVKLNHDGICAKLASINISYEPKMFAAVVTERAHMSHVAMALGSVSINNSDYEIFMANNSAMMATAFAMIIAVTAERSIGVNAEHLAKVWCIPHNDAALTLQVTSQSLCHDPYLSLSWNFGTNNWAAGYRKMSSSPICYL
jgi:hypothetical protein